MEYSGHPRAPCKGMDDRRPRTEGDHIMEDSRAVVVAILVGDEIVACSDDPIDISTTVDMLATRVRQPSSTTGAR